jgi:hypothetical protein
VVWLVVSYFTATLAQYASVAMVEVAAVRQYNNSISFQTSNWAFETKAIFTAYHLFSYSVFELNLPRSLLKTMNEIQSK